jgi:hypothetical protein
MTLQTMQARVLARLDDDPAGTGYHTGIDAANGLNWAQRFFVLLSLCLEKSATFSLTGATTWFKVRTTLTDWLLPLRVEVANAKIRPARLADLDALDAGWQSSAGTPERYSLLGLELLAIYKQPAGTTSASVTYARIPATMTGSGDSPEIPEEWHPVLIDGAVMYCRLKEGGQELDKVMPNLKRLVEGAGTLGNYVRQRSLDLRYDRLPSEIGRFDMSRMLKVLEKRLKPAAIMDTKEALRG